MKSREILPIENHSVWAVNRNGINGRYIKESKDNGIDISREEAGYRKLKKLGLRVPRVRLFPDKRKLLIEGAGTPLNKIFFESTEVALDVFESALNDLLDLWEKTKTEVDETQLERNYTLGSLKALEKIQATFLDKNKPIYINNKKYPSLGETIESCRTNLQLKREKLMVVSHGDEYSSNITAAQNSEGGYTGKHNFIDPRDVGYYRLSAVLNIIWGQTLLHNFKFQSSLQENEDTLAIKYHITPEQEKIYKRFTLLMGNFKKLVEQRLGARPELLGEFMFCNLARTLDDSTYQERYISKISPSKFAFFAIAIEIFYGTYKATEIDQ